MTATRPAIDPSGYYNVSQTAAALGVERHTVRRYEVAGLLKFRVRMASKRKVVSGSQIIKLWEKFY